MHEKVTNPTAGRSRLRRELRTARSVAGETQRQVADELSWSLSKVIRIESGQVAISVTDVRALLDHYGITDSDRIAALIALAKEGRRQEWSMYRDVLHPEFLLYLGYEGFAKELWQFEPLVVPGILQTPGYARALIESVAKPETPQDTIDKQVAARVERQALLDRDEAVEMHFILNESALRQWVGAPGNFLIWAEQLEWLRDVGRRPSVRIQVLPYTYGSHQGLAGGFVGLGFEDQNEDDILFLEGGRPNLVVRDNPSQVASYRKVFTNLRGGASDPDRFSDLIDEVLNTMPTWPPPSKSSRPA